MTEQTISPALQSFMDKVEGRAPLDPGQTIEHKHARGIVGTGLRTFPPSTWPHYPTSAELAALRWRLHEAGPSHGMTSCPVDVPRRDDGMPASNMLPGPAAWPHEREHGIGQLGYDPAFGAYALCDLADMRHAANVARHEQHEDDCQYVNTHAVGDERQSFRDNVRAFAPGQEWSY